MNFDDMMKVLKLSYLKDLESKLNALTKFQGKSEEKHEALRVFFHQLKGSGSTYGMPKISKIGKKYEDKLKSNTFSKKDFFNSKSELEKILKNHLIIKN